MSILYYESIEGVRRKNIVTPMGESEESERVISEFFNNSGVGLAIMDRKLRYRMINPYLAASNGAAVEAHLGKHLEEILGQVGIRVGALIERVFATNQAQLNWHIDGKLQMRPEKHWLASYFPIADSQGIVNQVAAVVVDLDLTGSSIHSPAANAEHELLRSWKDIARYLGTCVKTAQRWEHVQHFPIHRITQKNGSMVFAMSDEIDEWLRSRKRKR